MSCTCDDCNCCQRLTKEQKLEIVRLVFRQVENTVKTYDVIPQSVQQTLKILFPNGM